MTTHLATKPNSLYPGRNTVDCRMPMPMYRPFVVALIVAMAVLTALPGCDRQSASTAGDGKSGGSGAVPLKELRIGYYANLTHAQAVLGVASGEFQQAVGPAKV